ncbi:alpha/beta hydrolase [Nocardioides yefusunii]|uniref:Alpha/beta hydrolase n=1 Tax=Nocardioides yefusunii TaxID=2500546 RepID=A0ABW1QYS8_9ACTN|nr:alpha/beta hydrolase [Nocardioides yefusunii]
MVLTPQSRRAVALTSSGPKVTEDGYSIDAERARDRALALASAREDVAHVHDHTAVVEGCEPVTVRYYASTDSPAGLVVHLHGGGFVFNDVEIHDSSARRFANRSGLAVLSVEYRRPPEHRFPAAPDDVSTVVGWLQAGGVAELGLPDDVPLFAHGDSAGANLALVAALRHPGTFAAIALIYPFLDPAADAPSWYEESEGFDRAEALWYWEQYAATDADRSHPDMAPLLSDALATLPPTLVVTCEHDPCRDDGERLAVLLGEAGVLVTATRYLGLVHGFWRHPKAFDQAEPLMAQAGAFLRLHA